MATEKVRPPRYVVPDRGEKMTPLSPAVPLAFSASVAVAVATWQWPIRWLLSGTPILTFFILLGSSKGYRVIDILPLWTILSTINLVYAVAATSWLLYAVWTAAVYPAIFFTCLFQFDLVARGVRRLLRKAITQLQFVHDTIAFFDIPALEIDVDVDGLMVVRGLTVSLSTLTIVAHGVEVGIKLTGDIELAICVEKVTVPLFRRVEITDCFANVKGGEYEMTFGEIEDVEKDEDGDAVMVENTALLQAAAEHADQSRPKMIKMKSQMTGGVEMENTAARAGWRSIKTLSPEDRSAREQYESMLKWIKESNSIYQCRQEVRKEAGELDSRKDERAAICSKLHQTPTVPHPPKRSIKVTTLKQLSSPRARGLMHRMPLVLRMILNPISYFHPVTISSITIAGSGRWISHLIKTHLLKEYSQDNRELRRLEKRIIHWLYDANFVFELADIKGVASVPFLTSFDILTLLKFGDVIAYRTLAEERALQQVVRLGGADASFTIPSYLLPHHEHLLPRKPSREDKDKLSKDIADADGRPNQVLAERKLEQAEEDETNVNISAHVQLPACFSQDLLDFIAALVKATKVVEMEKEPGALESKISSIKELGQAFNKGMKDKVKKTVVDGIVSDRWIAKMVGKITKGLEKAQGDVGYSGDIPVRLEKYRLPDGHPEMNKLLP